MLDVVATVRRSDQQKDLELLLLRQQLRILQRKHSHPPRLSQWDKLGLAILAARLAALSSTGRSHLARVMLLFRPDTTLKLHREPVRRKWTFRRRRTPGRPPIALELEVLLVCLANENPRWGYSKLHGELLKLGYEIGRTTVRDVLKRHRVPPAPQCNKGDSSWHTCLAHYKEQMVACDFFTVETAWLKALYVLFFIEQGTRRVHLVGCTPRPTSAWVTQQARQMSWTLQDERLQIRFLLRDRDAKFSPSFDHVFEADEVTIIRTPFRSPKANASGAERWIRSGREECLDQLLILNERHLHRVLKEYVECFNHARPHQGLDQQLPAGDTRGGVGQIHRRDVRGGIIHDYYREAA